ncbi:b149.3 [miniopterid betaherpesvirus 1]|uniref:B149.3 n=1 Tax=miniopterid betaherpesvirus 1 TaxID=3070189 RepID=I3VQD6_9BETA|nr:b149.3 [miniopterid betaherpesvirus 1]AFK83980.1 b149.3 [miniopterid betaherpesvirus 1]
MFTRLGLCACVLLMCGGQLSHQYDMMEIWARTSIYNSECSEVSLEEAVDETNFSIECTASTSLQWFVCRNNKFFTVSDSTIIDDTVFRRLEDRLVGTIKSNLTAVGWYKCFNYDKCISERFFAGKNMIAFNYVRYGGIDVVICDNFFQDIVQPWIIVDGENVTQKCRSHPNGSLSYAAPHITKARCMSYLPCMNKTFHSVIFELHEKYTITNDTGDLQCTWTSDTMTYISSIKRIGGKYSSKGGHEHTDWLNVTDESMTSCGWCITTIADTIYISDGINLTDIHSSCIAFETYTTETEEFLKTSRASPEQSLRYATFLFATAFFIVEFVV